MTNIVKLLKRFFAFYMKFEFYKYYFSEKPLVTYVGVPTYHNVGDKMLFHSLRILLGNVNLVPVTPRYIVKEKWSYELADILFQIALKGFRRRSGTIFGGGTLINSSTFYFLLENSYIEKMPFIIFGTGSLDLEFYGNHLNKEIGILKKAEFVGVRDQNTKRALKSYNLDSVVIGDPVLSLCDPSFHKNKSIKKVGINIGCDKVMEGDQSTVNNTVGEFILYLLDKSIEVEFISMNDYDFEEISKVIDKFRLNKINIWKNYLDIEGFLKKVCEFDLVIGQRLHAVVTASGFGIPSISLSYTPKCLHFMESVELERLCINTKNIDIKSLHGCFREIVDNYSEVKFNLVEKTNKYRRLQEKYAKIIKNSIAVS